jgi:PAS domain S-box-containing protein
MLGRVRRAWRVCVAGAILAAGLYTVFRAVTPPSWALTDGLAILVVGMAGALVAALATLAVHTLDRPALRQLAGSLDSFLKSPSQHTLASDLSSAHADVDLTPLLGPLQALCQAYRKALEDRIEQDQALESFRLLLGRVDVEQGQRLTLIQRGSGSSRNMVARFTPNLSWMTATPALQQFLHCSANDLSGRPFAELVRPDSADLLQRTFHEALEAGEAHNVVFSLATKNGEERHVNMDVLTRYGEKGEPVHFRCFFTDITDQVRAEEELRRRTQELSTTNDQLRRINKDLERLKESYRDLYHNAPVMFFSLDTRGHFVTLNDTMVRALGYDREEILKHPYVRLLSPARLQAWQTKVSNSGSPAHALAEQAEEATQWVKRDGTVLDVWIRSVPLYDPTGNLIRCRSAALDVTERNRLAHELRTRSDELERTNAELRQINSELEDFTSVVSHDLKEPLRTLQAFSNFLAEDFAGQLGPDGFEYINHLVQASRRMGALIDDLLTLSWAGRITTTLQTFNLTETVATVRRDLADLILRKGATLQIEGSLPTVVGDPQRITQLLANLVGNALKYNTSRQPLVVIGQAADTEQPSGDAKTSSNMVTVFVRDNGIGIDPRYQEQVFGIFRRLHQSEEYEGTGAGLAICKKIVAGHAGRIWVESEPGKGSTFYFTLPGAKPIEPVLEKMVPKPRSRKRSAEKVPPDTEKGAERAAEPAPNLVATEENGPASPSRQESRPSVLLVEDMAEIGLIAQKLGQRAGHRVVWLKSGEEAWEYLQHNDPDLLLLDIHLPQMSGLELSRRIRQDLGRRDLAIALFSQANRPEDVAQARAAGANYLLSKDLLAQPEAWQRRLQEILDDAARSAAAPAS